MTKIFSIAFLALALASCQNSTDSEANDSLSVDSITMSTPAAEGTGSNILNTGDNNAGTPATASPAQGGGNAGALNPEHGMPGHRCDIAVGAPLSSAGKAPAAAAPVASPAPVMMPTPTPAPVQAAGAGQRLNPAHGLPGHDCAVPVGQPLKG